MASIHTNPSTHTLSSNDPPSSTYSNIPQIWPFHWSTFNPFNRPSFDDRMRRISMITILTARTFLDIPALYLFARRLEIPNLVLYLAIDVIAFVFIAWCLSVIGEAQGERRVLGKRVVSTLPSPDERWYDMLTGCDRVAGILTLSSSLPRWCMCSYSLDSFRALPLALGWWDRTAASGCSHGCYLLA